jgi:hypothetical protein
LRYDGQAGLSMGFTNLTEKQILGAKNLFFLQTSISFSGS